MSYQAIKAQIRENALDHLYLFWGAEAYLREHTLGQIRQIVLQEDTTGLNYIRFVGRDVDLSALENAIASLPAFAPQKLIVVEDFDFFKGTADKRDRLDEILADLPKDCVLIFSFSDPAFHPDKRMKIFRHFKDGGRNIEFPLQESNVLIPWVTKRFRALSKTIDRQRAEYLLFICGVQMTQLVGEVEKLSAYQTEETITQEAIDALCIKHLDAVVWQFTDALGKKDFQKAASVLAELLARREHPIMLLSAAGRQFRQLYIAKCAKQAGKNAMYLKKMLGLRSDYPAKLLLQGAGVFSMEFCRMALLHIA